MSAAEIHRRSTVAVFQSSQDIREYTSLEKLDADLTHLDHLPISDIRNRYSELIGRNAPPRFGIDLVRSAIAFRLQELSLGGLSRQVRLRLKARMGQSDKRNGSRSVVNTNAIIKPGTSFVREWKGELHKVLATDGGNFAYRGETYQSLSVIANEITGTHQSGPRFFGLRKTLAREQPNG